VAQQPNIELDGSDLPQRVAERSAERRWTPSRPGEITSPAEMPNRAEFGHPGPDTGWALRLLSVAEFDRSQLGLHGEDVVLAIIGARAGAVGRAPTPEDVEVALVLMGLRTDGLDESTVEAIRRHRDSWLRAAAHETSRGTAALAAIPGDVLAETPIHLRTRLRQRPDLLGA
jgi:hypothetical protein